MYGHTGTAKKSIKPFYPVKKSTIEALKKEVTTKSPSVVYSNASAAAGGITGAREPGDLPRVKTANVRSEIQEQENR